MEDAMEVMDEVTEKRLGEGKGAVDVLTALRWGGFVPDTELKSALEYYMFEYNNGVESEVVGSQSYGSTTESEGKETHQVSSDPVFILLNLCKYHYQ